jgi:hypothetical protein
MNGSAPEIEVITTLKKVKTSSSGVFRSSST